MTAWNALSASLLLITVSACDHESQQTDEFTESKDMTLREGPELASCRVEKGTDADPFLRTDRVLCKLARKTDFPLQPKSVLVSVASVKGPSGSSELAIDEREVARIHGDDYPVDVEIDASFSEAETDGLVGLGNSGFFKTFASRHVLRAPTEEAISVRFPFDLWPVEIRAKAASFSGALDPFSIDLTPLTTSSGESSITIDARLGTFSQGAKRYVLVPVTRGTKVLSGKATIGKRETAIALTGPGVYIVDTDGLRGATDADLNDFSGGPTFASCWTAANADTGKLDVLCKEEPVGGLRFAKLETLLGVEEATAAPGPNLESAETIVASVGADELPMTVWLRATLGTSDVVGIPSWQAERPFSVPVVIHDSATVAAPALFSLPFEVWPITVDAVGGSFLCDMATYAVPLSVEWGAASLIKVEGQATPFVNEGESSTFYVVADSRVQSLACEGLIVSNTGDVTEGVDVVLVRGGRYTVTAKTVQSGD